MNSLKQHQTKTMKQSLLIALIVVLSILSVPVLAQKKDTVKTVAPNPGWIFQGVKTFSTTITIPAGLINDVFFINQNGGPIALQNSETLNGKQITYYSHQYQAFMDSVISSFGRSFNKFIIDDKKKFTADSLAKATKVKKP